MRERLIAKIHERQSYRLTSLELSIATIARALGRHEVVSISNA